MNGLVEDVNGRVMVLEKDVKRHENDLSKLWEKVSAMDLCLTALPRIETLQAEIASELKDLKECKLREEGAARMKTGTWAVYGPWIKDIVFLVLGAVAIILWQTALNLNGVGK